MNQATRAALQKRKQALASSRQLASSIPVEEVREATRRKLAELLSEGINEDDKANTKSIAKDIEAALQKEHGAHTAAYKSGFRRLFATLKRKNSNFKADLLDGTLRPEVFATMSAEELKSADQKKTEEKLKEEGIRQSVGKQLTVENVNQIKDGRDREKWGVSRSAAAIDD